MSRQLLVAFVAGLLALGVAACDGEPEVRAEPTPIPISAECREAFATAVAIAEEEAEEVDEEEVAIETGVGAGSLSDLVRTLPACDTTTEWFEAYRATWTERTEGISPVQALRTLCARDRHPEVRDAEICRQLVVDGPAEEPGQE